MEPELFRGQRVYTVGELFIVPGGHATARPKWRRQTCDGSGYWGWHCLRCPKKVEEDHGTD